MKHTVKLIAGAGTALALTAAFLIAVFTVTGGNLDVVGSDSAAAFGRVLEAAPALVAPDEESGGWSLAAPDGSARFSWGRSSGGSDPELLLEADAAPFLSAGLEAGLLPEGYALRDGKLLLGTALSAPASSGAATPLAAYEALVKDARGSIGYHSALDHYNISLGGGNLLEWARSLDKNSVTGEAQDKDLVFVLNPEPLIAAGVDPEQVAGWIYAPVTMEMGGKVAEVYKFLKPFNLG